MKHAVAAAAVLAVHAASAGSVLAQELAEFFKRQPFTIIVGSPAGGSYDFYARAIARQIGRYLPGQPSVVVQNLPGGGGYLAANFIFTGAAKDGSVIATFSRSVPMQPLYDRSGVSFDPLRLAWIGSPSDEASVVLSWHATPLKTFADLRGRGITVASTGPGTDSNVYARLIANTFKLNTRIVTGYRGAADMLLAVERGEVDGVMGLSWSSVWPAKKDLVDSGKFNFLAQLAMTPRADRLKGVPLLVDLADNAADRRLLEVMFARQTVAFPYAAPPQTPPARLEAIRAAFNKTLADQQFLAEAEKANMSINPVSGDDIAGMLKRIYASEPGLIERVKAVLAEPAGPK